MKSIVRVLTIQAAMLLALMSARAQDAGQVKVSIDLQDVTLEEAFRRIEALTPFTISYKTSDLAGSGRITCRLQQESVAKLLQCVLANTSLQYEQVQQHILIKKKSIASQDIQRATIHGFVTAAESGESLSGATIILSGERQYSAITNSYGFYSVTLPKGSYQLTCSFIGFADYLGQIDISKSVKKNIELALKQTNLQEIKISAPGKRNIVQRTISGYHQLNIATIKALPAPGGEPDILKSLQLLPGVQTSNEGTANLSIRGGSFDQNLILLDEAPVYNPTHTLGFFSVFNSDAIKDVSVYKGIFPPQYGGRLSSVIDLRMKEGNNKQHSATGGIGLLASRLTWEGPVWKDKSSFIISGRYSNLGPLLNLAYKSGWIDARTNSNEVSFYDVNAKFNIKTGPDDRIYLSAYTGSDHFYMPLIDNTSEINWGNTTVTARWNHIFNPRMFANTVLLYSRYNYASSLVDDVRKFAWKARLEEITFKSDVDWTIHPRHLLKWGAGITWQNVLPGKIIPNSDQSAAKAVSLNNRRSMQLFAYANAEQKLSSRISLSYGVRATYFASLGDALVYRYNADTTEVIDSTWYPKGKKIASWFTAGPSISARILLNPASSLKLAYGRNYQFQHLLSNSSVGLPTDIWIPSDIYFKPQYADHFTAGYFRSFDNDAYEASLELYYRKSYNIIDFKDNAELFLNDKIETQVLTGHGKGYGLELLLKKNKGKSNGWISYTWSKALRRINGVNNNEWYPPVYDHRHNISVVYNRPIRKRLSLSVNWVFRSGGRATVPEGVFWYYSTPFFYYTSRNGYTLPSNHRLDLSVVWSGKENKKKGFRGEWVFNIYNVYNRKNIFALYINPIQWRYSLSGNDKPLATKVYLTGILPSVTYNFKF